MFFFNEFANPTYNTEAKYSSQHTTYNTNVIQHSYLHYNTVTLLKLQYLSRYLHHLQHDCNYIYNHFHFYMISFCAADNNTIKAGLNNLQ